MEFSHTAFKYNPRTRSPVFSLRGIAASSQPIATKVGTQVLERGGTAADACVAMAAVLSVTEPCSTGLGGDAFALYYTKHNNKVVAINGSGCSPRQTSLHDLLHHFKVPIDPDTGGIAPGSVHAVTVPGACAAWADLLKQHGRMDLKTVLQPAVDIARGGFPMSPVTAEHWERETQKLKESSDHGTELLVQTENGSGRAPKPGEIWTNPHLASVLESIQEHGSNAFYRGWIAERIVEAVAARGGTLTKDDLAMHRTRLEDSPVNVKYGKHLIYEVGMNSQGLVALMALNMLDGIELNNMEHNSTEYLHILIETLRVAFADARQFITDPQSDIQGNNSHQVTEALLGQEYAEKQRSRISVGGKAATDVKHGSPLASSDTVYLCCVDGDGNACSLVNSNYMGFGSGIVPRGCGFTLQNRGANFSLDPKHPNCYGANKRTYHTIIPGIMTDLEGNLECAFGVMGGFMQPQGHVQVLLNMLIFGMDPQQALDVPRFCIGGFKSAQGGTVALEDGIDEKVVRELEERGHNVHVVRGTKREVFGRGQIIALLKNGPLCAGSDLRADGNAEPVL